jgi:hypothetical protein
MAFYSTRPIWCALASRKIVGDGELVGGWGVVVAVMSNVTHAATSVIAPVPRAPRIPGSS